MRQADIKKENLSEDINKSSDTAGMVDMHGATKCLILYARS